MSKTNWLISKERHNAGRIESLISIMEYARDQTTRLVEGMSAAQLDFVPDNYDNNVGTLLKHLCYTERYTQVVSFEGSFAPGENDFWEGTKGGTMQPVRRWNKPASYYLHLFAQIRQRSLILLSDVDDAWLQTSTFCPLNLPTNQFMMWAHLIEEQFGHTYQMRMIIKKIAVAVT